MNIFIGNLSYNVAEGDLYQTFEAFGQVASAAVIKDKQSGRSKGFGLRVAHKNYNIRGLETGFGMLISGYKFIYATR